MYINLGTFGEIPRTSPSCMPVEPRKALMHLVPDPFERDELD